MEIRILNGGRGRELNAAIMASALIAGKRLTQNNPYVWFEVNDWDEFLHIVWDAHSEYSKLFTLPASPIKVHVVVAVSQNRNYNTEVWYSIEHGGLHYVSLY